jgi:hypothetical protein
MLRAEDGPRTGGAAYTFTLIDDPAHGDAGLEQECFVGFDFMNQGNGSHINNYVGGKGSRTQTRCSPFPPVAA